MFGLLKRDITILNKVFNNYPQIEKVIIFGSRAMGNYKKGSDVDLSIIGTKIQRKLIRSLSDDLNEIYPLPYFFDILNYNEITNNELKKHIDTEGKLLYEKSINFNN